MHTQIFHFSFYPKPDSGGSRGWLGSLVLMKVSSSHMKKCLAESKPCFPASFTWSINESVIIHAAVRQDHVWVTSHTAVSWFSYLQDPWRRASLQKSKIKYKLQTGRLIHSLGHHREGNACLGGFQLPERNHRNEEFNILVKTFLYILGKSLQLAHLQARQAPYMPPYFSNYTSSI